MKEIHVPTEAAGMRLDAFLATILTDMSRSALQRLVQEEQIRVEGKLPPRLHEA